MVKRLADIVKQAGSLCSPDVGAKFRSHEACEVRDLERMIEHVLTVARAVFELAEELDDLGVDVVDACVNKRPLARLLNGRLDLSLSLIVHFLDPCGVDPAVGNELLKSDSCDLSADGIEAGYRDSLGRVVDNKVDARYHLERADVSALTADDSALHFVIGQRHDGDGSLGGVVGGAALDGRGDYLTGDLLCLVLCLLLIFLDLDGFLVVKILLKQIDDICLCLLLSEARDPLEHIKLALL